MTDTLSVYLYMSSKANIFKSRYLYKINQLLYGCARKEQFVALYKTGTCRETKTTLKLLKLHTRKCRKQKTLIIKVVFDRFTVK